MEKRFFFVVVLVAVCALSALSSSASLSLGFDAMAIDAAWTNLLDLRVEACLALDEGFSLRVPLSWRKRLSSRDLSLIDVGLFLDYRPFGGGFFVSMGVAQGAFFFGRDRPVRDKCFLNELAFGYTWFFTPHWFVEPKLEIRDPTGVYADSMASLQGELGSYPMVRFSLVVGGIVLAVPTREEEGRVEDGKGEEK